METTKTLITVEANFSVPVEKVWRSWTEPQHITQWNQASPDWHCPKATNDLREGGKFSSTMAARDGSMSFDFGGVHTKVEHHKHDERRTRRDESEVDSLPEARLALSRHGFFSVAGLDIVGRPTIGALRFALQFITSTTSSVTSTQ